MTGYISYRSPNEDWLNAMSRFMGFAVVGAFAASIAKTMIEDTSPEPTPEEAHNNPNPEPILIPFAEAPKWVRKEWQWLYGRTRPRVELYRTEVARITPPTFEYAVRNIVAHKKGQIMRRYVPSYDTLLASTREDRTLYFGGGVKLKPGEAIAVMDYWGDRFQGIKLYIHPADYEPPKLIKPDLTERQMKILATISAYKPRYRREVLKAAKVTQDELDELRKMGLIDARGAITITGRNIVGAEDPWGMIDLY
ncbi:hypothetical protein M1O54_00165 [Dehalococcoidia bacterium]|nr:hypothetical protein [Dehalococcoidia bacterium]